jgi:hypothetical protein
MHVPQCSPVEKNKDENVSTLDTAIPAPADAGLNPDDKD